MTESRSYVVWVILREDGGPSDQLQDLNREPDDHEWACRVKWTVSRERAVANALELRAPVEGRVDSHHWRWVRVAEVLGNARDVLEVAGHLQFMAGDPDEYEHTLLESGRFAGPRRGARTPEHFEFVANVYNQAVRSGDPHPVKKVRVESIRLLGVNEATEAAVKGWVREAKRRGLITQTVRPPRSPRRRGTGHENRQAP